jgi:hypothetical protein
MKTTHSNPDYVVRRSELLAELFLQDLKPTFLSRPTRDIGVDFFIGFNNSRGGINTFGVEVKGTQQPISTSFALDEKTYRRLANSNVPVCLLVVDAKQNRMFYAWAERDSGGSRNGASKVNVPVTEIDEKTRIEFLNKLAS